MTDGEPYEGPYFEMIRSSSPVARREHRCDCCPDPITKGTKHDYCVYAEDGKFMTSRRHFQCPREIAEMERERELEVEIERQREAEPR